MFNSFICANLLLCLWYSCIESRVSQQNPQMMSLLLKVAQKLIGNQGNYTVNFLFFNLINRVC